MMEMPDAILICGGLGTRLKTVLGQLPKPLVEVNGRPFLDYLVDDLIATGVSRIIFSSGYRAQVIREHYSNRRDAEFVFSEETSPLGTAGALKLAESRVRSEVFLAMNGDSYCAINYKNFLESHRRRKARASLALVEVTDASDYGGVRMDDAGWIRNFAEKTTAGRGRVNAGIYLFSREVFASIPAGQPCSLEREVFPTLLETGVAGYLVNAALYDIGTPERLERARAYFAGRSLRP